MPVTNHPSFSQRRVIHASHPLVENHEEEKSLNELLSKAIFNEVACKNAEKEFFEPVNKLVKMDANLFNEDVRKFVQ